MGLKIEDIYLALQNALLGEIYPEIRAIAFDYQKKNKQFTIRYYLDREPTDDDYESVSVVMTEFISHFSYREFESLKEECTYSTLPKSKLDSLSGFAYSRLERNY